MRNAPLADDARNASSARAKRRWLPSVLLVLFGLVVAGWVVQDWTGGRDDPEQLLGQARSAWSSGRLDDAEAALARLSKSRHPATVPERLLRSQVARDRGRFEQASAALEGVPDSDPDAALIWLARGLLDFQRDRARPAEAALLRALTLNPKLAEARRGLVDLYTIELRRADLSSQLRALARTGALGFDDVYLWCLGRRQDVGPAELAAKLEQMMRNDADDRMIRLALAENRRRLGRLDLALAALAPLPADDLEARAARARLAIDRGAVNEAARLLAEAPADHAGLARLRGRLALARGDVAAIGDFRAALLADPDDRDTLFGLGQALRVAGKAAAARPYLDAAAAHDHLEWLIQNARSLSERDDPKTLSALGDACRALGRLPEAQAWYRLALARDPLAADVQKRLFELDAKLGGDNDSAKPGK